MCNQLNEMKNEYLIFTYVSLVPMIATALFLQLTITIC